MQGQPTPSDLYRMQNSQRNPPHQNSQRNAVHQNSQRNAVHQNSQRNAVHQNNIAAQPPAFIDRHIVDIDGIDWDDDVEMDQLEHEEPINHGVLGSMHDHGSPSPPWYTFMQVSELEIIEASLKTTQSNLAVSLSSAMISGTISEQDRDMLRSITDQIKTVQDAFSHLNPCPLDLNPYTAVILFLSLIYFF